MNLLSKPARLLPAVLAVLTLSACAPATIKNTVDIADGVHFGDFKTYAWITDDSLLRVDSGASALANPINERRVRSAIEHELAGKGYRKVAHSDADFVVSYRLGSQDRVRVRQFYNDFGYRYYGFHRGFSRFGHHGFGRFGYPGYGGYGSRLSVQTITEGNLVVDIFDNRSKEAIWHGVATKRLSQADRDNAADLINQAAASLFSDFPAKDAMPKVMEELMSRDWRIP